MRWTNKGHEFDVSAKKYSEQGILSKGIYIFGAGEKGGKFSSQFKRFFMLKGFIDNDEKKQGMTYLDYPVISLDTYVDEKLYEFNLVVLCLNEKYSNEVKEQLTHCGAFDNKAWMLQEEFEHKLRVSLLYEKNILYVPIAQISLTERCTLRCKKCAHACNLVSKSKKDMTLIDAKRSLDVFFSHIDYIHEFVLIGGEPLLYKDIADVIAYIGENYREKIKYFTITTNGTLIPDSKVVDLCNKFDVMFRISNYVSSIPSLRKRHEIIIKTLDKANVKYILYNEDGTWMDYGFDWVDRKASEVELEEVFDKCNTPCHEIRGEKFYFCVMARSVSENMKKGEIGTEDYLDMGSLSPKKRLDKVVFFEYLMGYSEKGFLDMCNYCNGADSKKFPVPIAEQDK